MNEWYAELGARLEGVDCPATGFQAAAVALVAELWRIAAVSTIRSRTSRSEGEAATKALEADRDATRADTKTLATLNQELIRRRSSAEKSPAEARALLSRRKAALDEERLRNAELSRNLAADPIERGLTWGRSKRPAVHMLRARASRNRSSVRNRAPKSPDVKLKKRKESLSRNAQTRPRVRRPKPPRRK